MAKKNMDMLISNIMGSPVDTPQTEAPIQDSQNGQAVSEDKAESIDAPWKHFSFICSVELAEKVQAIAHKEGFTIRAFMEYMMRQGIAQYEAKHGKARKIKMKAVKDVM